MTQQTHPLITEIEKKINETKQLIINYKQQIANNENLLQSLINQLSEIKNTMKINNKNNSLKGDNK